MISNCVIFVILKYLCIFQLSITPCTTSKDEQEEVLAHWYIVLPWFSALPGKFMDGTFHPHLPDEPLPKGPLSQYLSRSFVYSWREVSFTPKVSSHPPSPQSNFLWQDIDVPSFKFLHVTTYPSPRSNGLITNSFFISLFCLLVYHNFSFLILGRVGVGSIHMQIAFL